MINWSNKIPEVCAYGTAADYCQLPNADQLCRGVVPLDSLPAPWWNAMWHDNNEALNCSRAFVNNVGQELCNIITCRGGTLNENCNSQLYSTIFAVGNANAVGMVKSSAADGQVAIDANGIMTVNGYSTLSTTVTNQGTAIGTLQSSVNGQGTAIGALQTCVGNLSTCDTCLRTDISTIQTCILCLYAASNDLICCTNCLSTDIGTLQTCVGNTALCTTAQTLTGAVNELNTAVTGHGTAITDLQGVVGNAALCTTAQTVTEAVNELKDAIDNFQGVTYSDSTPLVDGTASAGTCETAARGDHVHPIGCCIRSVCSYVLSQTVFGDQGQNILYTCGTQACNLLCAAGGNGSNVLCACHCMGFNNLRVSGACGFNQLCATGVCGRNRLNVCGDFAYNLLCACGYCGYNQLSATGSSGYNSLQAEGSSGYNQLSATCNLIYASCCNEFNAATTTISSSAEGGCIGINTMGANSQISLDVMEGGNVCISASGSSSRVAIKAYGACSGNAITAYGCCGYNTITAINDYKTANCIITTKCTSGNPGAGEEYLTEICTKTGTAAAPTYTMIQQWRNAAYNQLLLAAIDRGNASATTEPTGVEIAAMACYMCCSRSPFICLHTGGDAYSGESSLKLCTRSPSATAGTAAAYNYGCLQYDGNLATVKVGRSYNGTIILDHRTLQIELDAYSNQYGSSSCNYPPTLEVRHGIVDAVQTLAYVNIRYCCRSGSSGSYTQEVFYSNQSTGMIACKGCGGCANCLAYFTPDYGLLRIYDDLSWHTTGKCVVCSSSSLADENTWGFLVYKR